LYMCMVYSSQSTWTRMKRDGHVVGCLLGEVVQALDDLEMWALVGLGMLRLKNAHDAFDESSC
jgi:hypothetical protein